MHLAWSEPYIEQVSQPLLRRWRLGPQVSTTRRRTCLSPSDAGMRSGSDGVSCSEARVVSTPLRAVPAAAGSTNSTNEGEAPECAGDGWAPAPSPSA